MLHSRLLRYLDEIARMGSIRKAATRLNVAPSAVNRQLIALEDELGVVLFERMPRGLRLTASGEVLIEHVRETLRAHERAVGRIAALKGMIGGQVVVATMGGLAAGLLGTALHAFRTSHPTVRLVVRVLPREALVQALLAGEADLGLAYDMVGHPRLQLVGSFDYRVGAVVAPDHPLASRLSVRFSDCMQYPLVVPERSMSLRDVIERITPVTADWTPVLETNSIELMKKIAAEAPHVAFLNYADVSLDLGSGALVFVPLGLSGAKQTISLVHRAKGALAPVASVVSLEIAAALRAIAG